MLKVKNLSFSVDGTEILHDVSLEVHRGGFVGILGPNGSGKSTLLKNIYKVLKPQKGEIELMGQDLLAMTNREMARLLAVVGQEHESSFDFLVEEVVLMGCQARKRLTEGFDQNDRKDAQEALRQVDMADFSQRSYLSLSGGEKQRVLIARALVQKTDLMILDEPTNHLDIGSQIKTMNLLKNSGKTIVAALHDLSIAAKYCDTIFVLQNGRNVVDGDPKEVITQSMIRQLYDIDVSLFSHDGELYLQYKTD
ncbi:MAG: ABC transporter ATP-binding protein [Eubacteriales bacterium]|nr:ABC transporter ATP-binding protein [Eubacteriales bacterium]